MHFKVIESVLFQYHTGYQQQMSNWPELPVNSIINWLLSRSSSLVVADFGCGEIFLSYFSVFFLPKTALIDMKTVSGDARIAKSVKNKVFSFDLVSKNPSVIACDMSNVHSNCSLIFRLHHVLFSSVLTVFFVVSLGRLRLSLHQSMLLFSVFH